MQSRRIQVFLWILLIAVGLLNMAAQWGMHYSGDDFSYLSHFRFADGSDGHFVFPLDFPKFVASHWLDQNGRMANYIAALLLYGLPERALMLLNGLMQALMFWIVLRAAGCFRASVLSGTLLLSVLAYALPWWDSMQVADCSINYVWSTVAVIAFMQYMGTERAVRQSKALGAIFGFVAGSMHEAASLPLLAGMVCYCLLHGIRPERRQYAPLAGFVLGVAWCVLSPGIISRAGESIAPDDTPVMLLLKSCPVTLLMVLLIGAALIWRGGRRRLLELIKSPWLIYAVAATVSACICAIGGIVGRSGWFSEVFALIALWQWAGACRLWPRGGAAWALSTVAAILLLVHYAGFASRQLDCGKQIERMRKEYLASADGTVYMPEVKYEDTMPWWLLWKPRGVPDADDSYQLERFANYYSRGIKPLTVIPFDRERLREGNFPVSERGFTVTDRCPEGVVTGGNERERNEVAMVRDAGGNISVLTPFSLDGRRLYLLSPLILDPGDRL